MSKHEFIYSAESLHKDKIQNLEKELESDTKVFNVKHMDMSDKLER